MAAPEGIECIPVPERPSEPADVVPLHPDFPVAEEIEASPELVVVGLLDETPGDDLEAPPETTLAEQVQHVGEAALAQSAPESDGGTTEDADVSLGQEQVVSDESINQLLAATEGVLPRSLADSLFEMITGASGEVIKPIQEYLNTRLRAVANRQPTGASPNPAGITSTEWLANSYVAGHLLTPQPMTPFEAKEKLKRRFVISNKDFGTEFANGFIKLLPPKE